MPDDAQERRLPAELWTEGLPEHEGARCDLEVAAEDGPAEISVHTFIEGRGSMISFVLDRERALMLALELMRAAVLR